jgi:hypothetical protein
MILKLAFNSNSIGIICDNRKWVDPFLFWKLEVNLKRTRLELGEEVQRNKRWNSYLKILQNLNGIMGHTGVILLMQAGGGGGGGIYIEMLFNPLKTKLVCVI